jgi:Rrf2 family protein
MAANSRLSVSIHIMTSLAWRTGDAVTSDYLAKSVNTNPVVIRRILSQLRKAGLIHCQAGKSGGCRLAKPASEITLYDIYHAVESDGPFAIPEKAENKACAVSCHMKKMLQKVFSQAQEAMGSSLRRVKLTDLVKEVREAQPV